MRAAHNSKLNIQHLRSAYTIACTPSVLSTAVAMATISFSIVFKVSLFILFMVFDGITLKK